jgi:hypothetical protein
MFIIVLERKKGRKEGRKEERKKEHGGNTPPESDATSGAPAFKFRLLGQGCTVHLSSISPEKIAISSHALIRKVLRKAGERGITKTLQDSN